MYRFIQLLLIMMILGGHVAHAQRLDCPSGYYEIVCRSPLKYSVAFYVDDDAPPPPPSGEFRVVGRDDLDYHYQGYEFLREDSLSSGRAFRNGNCTFLDRAIRPDEPNMIIFRLGYYNERAALDKNVERTVSNSVELCNATQNCQFHICVRNNGWALDADRKLISIKY